MRYETKYESNKFWFKLKLSFFLVITWWLTAFLAFIIDSDLSQFGIRPKELSSLFNILTYPFIHGDFEHLSSNSLSGFMLFSTLFVIYEKHSIKVLALIYLFSGIILWFIGEKGSLHVGASGVIYGVGFFIFVSGIIIRDSANIAIALFMVAWYGSMIWGITPFTTASNISWEGHLSGAIMGTILALWFHREMIIQKKYIHFEEDEEEDFHFYEKYPLDL